MPKKKTPRKLLNAQIEALKEELEAERQQHHETKAYLDQARGDCASKDDTLRHFRGQLADAHRKRDAYSDALSAACRAVGLCDSDWGRLPEWLKNDLRQSDQFKLDLEAAEDRVKFAQLNASRCATAANEAKKQLMLEASRARLAEGRVHKEMVLVAERTRQRDLAAGDYVELHEEAKELQALHEKLKIRCARKERQVKRLLVKRQELTLDLDVAQKKLANAETSRKEDRDKRASAERAAGRVVGATLGIWIAAALVWLYFACS